MIVASCDTRLHCTAASQTTGVEVVVAQVPIPDTKMIAELFLMDTSGGLAQLLHDDVCLQGPPSLI